MTFFYFPVFQTNKSVSAVCIIYEAETSIDNVDRVESQEATTVVLTRVTLVLKQCKTVYYNKKLSYGRVTARCVLSVVILPITTNSAETTYTTSPDQTDGIKLEV